MVGGWRGTALAVLTLLRRRPFVIDTIQDDCGPELMVESSWPLEGLVKLAAAGDWSKIDELRGNPGLLTRR